MIFVSGFYDLSLHEHRRTPREEWVKRSEWLFAHESLSLVFFGGLNRDVKLDWSYADPIVDFEPVELLRVDSLLSRSKLRYDGTKDTSRYLCLMKSRYDWMLRVANSASPHQVITWVDVGLPHDPQDTLHDVAKRDPLPGKIRMAAISYVPRYARADLDVYYSRHWWPVGGGLWSARPPEIAWLHERIEEEWRRALDLGFAVTDEMMLGRIVLAHPEKFDLYHADHTSLAANWCGITRSHRLIAEMALRALEDGSPDEASERFLALGWKTMKTLADLPEQSSHTHRFYK